MQLNIFSNLFDYVEVYGGIMNKFGIKICIAALTLMLTSQIGYSMILYDREYKKDLIKASGHKEYTMKNMQSVMGEKELTKVIKRYNKHPEKYQSDKYERGDRLGVEKLTYRAGLHSHTTFSDGKMTPEETLNQAAEYANRVKKKYPFEKYPMIIAITDHFNTQGCQNAIYLIQKNPEKYKNVKFVIGMETQAYVEVPSKKEVKGIHMLAWCINPYDWPFKDMNFQEAMSQEGVYKGLNFLNYKDFVNRVHSLKYGLVGIAHPLRYFDKDEMIDSVIDDLFAEYASMKDHKILFTEGYYQPYRFDTPERTYNQTIETAHKYGIYTTGSQDSHGYSIFRN